MTSDLHDAYRRACKAWPTISPSFVLTAPQSPAGTAWSAPTLRPADWNSGALPEADLSTQRIFQQLGGLTVWEALTKMLTAPPLRGWSNWDAMDDMTSVLTVFFKWTAKEEHTH
jgi:hypothetical protein